MPFALLYLIVGGGVKSQFLKNFNPHITLLWPPRLSKIYSYHHPLILLLSPHFNDFEVQFGSASIASKLSLFFSLHFISDGQIKLKIFIKIQFCPPPPQPKVLFTLKSFLKCNFLNQKVNRNQKLKTPTPLILKKNPILTKVRKIPPISLYYDPPPF